MIGLDSGVLFRAASGLYYRDHEAAGSVASVRVNGVVYLPQPEPNKQTTRYKLPRGVREVLAEYLLYRLQPRDTVDLETTLRWDMDQWQPHLDRWDEVMADALSEVDGQTDYKTMRRRLIAAAEALTERVSA